jgi:hypothetical protein
MTCVEFHKIVETIGREPSMTELVAAIKHMHVCTQCREFTHLMSAMCTPTEAARAKSVAEVYAPGILRMRFDPEA